MPPTRLAPRGSPWSRRLKRPSWSPSSDDFLGALAAAAAGLPDEANAAAWQDLVFRTAAEAGATNRAAFVAIYLAFYGLPQGPRAGRVLATQPRGILVIERLRAASTTREVTA